jgi:hypothetical protein
MTAKAKKPNPNLSPIRHPFLYEMVRGDGTKTVHKAWAAVIKASKPVTVVLTEDHVNRSMALNGAGSTSQCSVAICTYNHRAAFPHPVEGHIDFNYSRAFVVTRLDKQGLPRECVAYEHSAGSVAKLNDSPGGYAKLLVRIQKSGPLAITLRPYRVRSAVGRNGAMRPASGTRSPIKTYRGAKLRYATMQLGAMPAPVPTENAQ